MQKWLILVFVLSAFSFRAEAQQNEPIPHNQDQPPNPA